MATPHFNSRVDLKVLIIATLVVKAKVRKKLQSSDNVDRDFKKIVILTPKK